MRTETVIKTEPYDEYKAFCFMLTDLPISRSLELIKKLKELKDTDCTKNDIKTFIWKSVFNNSQFYFCDGCDKFFEDQDFNIYFERCFKCQQKSDKYIMQN